SAPPHSGELQGQGPGGFRDPPPPPTPCVLPFQAPSTPPVPPSRELSGKPTRMLMFWLPFSPNRMFTWQYATFGPLAGIIRLFTDLTPALPDSPGASSEQSGTAAAKVAGANIATPNASFSRICRIDVQCMSRYSPLVCPLRH